MATTADFAKRRTFHTLDGLRGIAALAVLTQHYATVLAPIRLRGSYLAVDLFFVMSGMVIAHAYEGKLRSTLTPWRFFGLRFVRLAPLYLMGLALTIVMVTGALTLGRSEHWTWATFLPLAGMGLLMLPNVTPSAHGELYPLNPPAWSLFWEMVINLAYALVGYRMRNAQLAIVCALSGVAMIVLAGLRGSLDHGFRWDDWEMGLARVSFSFPLGVILYRLHRAERWRLPAPPAWTLLLAVAGLMALPRMGATLDLLTALVAFPAICLLALGVEPSNVRLYAFLGVISYPLYVLQIPIPSERIASAILGRPAVSLAPYSGIAITIGLLAICWVAAKWIDPLARRVLTLLVLRREPARDPAAMH